MNGKEEARTPLANGEAMAPAKSNLFQASINELQIKRDNAQMNHGIAIGEKRYGDAQLLRENVEDYDRAAKLLLAIGEILLARSLDRR